MQSNGPETLHTSERDEYNLEALSADRDALADVTVQICNDIAKDLDQDPTVLLDKKDAIELLIRNPAVLTDRIVEGAGNKEVAGVPEKGVEEMRVLKRKVGGLLTACQIEYDEGTELHALSSAVASGRIPLEASGLANKLMKESVLWFSSIVADQNVDITNNLQGYFAGNTKATVEAMGRNHPLAA